MYSAPSDPLPQQKCSAGRLDYDECTQIAKKLTSIWLRVLARPSIRMDEDFFETGGDPNSAIRIFDEIRVEFGRSIPPLAIYSFRTISSLADLLSHKVPARFSNLLLLRNGAKLPGTFLFPGLGGNVMEFFALSECIGSTYPVYGLQPSGSDGLEEPLDRIEEMAAYHLDAIRGLQAGGPYLLCGYSLGGLVALEVARQIRESGERVGLCMIDSYPHESALAARQRFRSYFDRINHRAACALDRSKRSIDGGREGKALNEKIGGPTIRKVREKAYRALVTYRPRPYHGKVLFLRAAIPSGFPDVAAWKNLIGEIEVVTVPGDHHSMLRIGAPHLSAAISSSLCKAVRY
ncbi:MAG: thioesterase domain-containing protein [Candidatus Acidiferrales bacterium]